MAKSLRNRYSKNLFGVNHQGYFSTAVAYATAGTLAAFSRAGLEGQVGMFLADGTLKSDALAAGDIFQIAQIKDGELRKTHLITYGAGNLAITATPYDAAVKQVNHVGYNGTAGSLGFSSIAVGDEYVVSARDTTPGTQPFPVSEARVVITTLANLTEYKIVNQLVADLLNSNDYERNADNGFLVPEIIVDTAQVANGALTLAVTNGSKHVTYSADPSLSAGDFVGILGILYQVESAVTTAVVLDRVYTGATAATLPTGTDKATDHGNITIVDGTSELGIQLTAITEDTNFVVSVGDDLAGATLTNSTAWKQGSGEPWQTSAIEAESIVFDGFTTGNIAFAEDYGKPTLSVDPDGAVGWDLWFLKYKKTTPSMAFPNESAEHFGYIVMGALESGTTPTANFDTVLGT